MLVSFHRLALDCTKCESSRSNSLHPRGSGWAELDSVEKSVTVLTEKESCSRTIKELTLDYAKHKAKKLSSHHSTSYPKY